MKIAFMYSGQGSQHPRMGYDVIDAFSIAQKTIEEAETYVSFPLKETMGSDLIHETRYTQPALLALCWAIDRVLTDFAIKPDYVCGLSLGEYTALLKGGAMDFQTAVKLVEKRGQLMQAASEKQEGKMLAVLSKETKIVEDLCEKLCTESLYVAPANYNTDEQLVVGGDVEAIGQLKDLLEADHGIKAIPLQVSGAFHTAHMEGVSKELYPILSDISWSEPLIPVLSNTTVDYHTKERIASWLERQVKEPVYWKQSIYKLLNEDVDVWIEIGPGKVLSQMVKKIAKNQQKNITVLQANSVQGIETIRQFFEENRR